MRADLLEPERRHRRQRRAGWLLGGTALLAAAAWLLEGPVIAYLAAPPPPTSTAKVAPKPTAAPVSTASPSADAAKPAAAAGVQTRPLSAWLGDVAREAGRDLVVSPELHGELTATAGGKLPWEQRLAAFARVFGFDFVVGDGLIEVSAAARPSPPGRGSRDATEPGADPAEARPGAGQEGAVSPGPASSTEGEHGPGPRSPGGPGGGGGEAPSRAAPSRPQPPIETRVAPLAHAPAKELAVVVGKAGDALEVGVVADLSTNSLVVSGTRAAIDRAFAVIRELDKPRRRVLLEAKILEIARSARLDLGVEWKLAGDVGADVRFPPPLSLTGSAALVLATDGAYALDARISAMEADGRVRVVSRPSVVMLEGNPATIESVRILRIRLPSRGDVVGGETVEVDNGQKATEEIPVGVRLEVTPAVRAGRRVLLRIRAKSSSLGAPLPPDDIPEELSRMVDAELMVSSGETAVLGGLQREVGQRSGAGVPLLRDIPGLGNLFGRHSREQEHEELLIMVTPRVLD